MLFPTFSFQMGGATDVMAQLFPLTTPHSAGKLGYSADDPISAPLSYRTVFWSPTVGNGVHWAAPPRISGFVFE
ncbi:hypothetical protein [Stieleria tagensis]|uniref:hypothetical protein n=1 Tax=Stieleria tagensis TaxID=2956795 RepID=UPI00209AF7F8|nr:hypothetical protein [Stieleria tagensis]